MAHSDADYFRLIGQVADWKAEADRLQRIAVARSEESDAFERERDEALQERDRARELHREEKERADLLAEALHGSYGTEHRWRLACEQALTERDRAREAIAFVLEEHHLGYCTLRADTLTILTAAGGCLKKEEEEGPSPANVTVGEQADDANHF